MRIDRMGQLHTMDVQQNVFYEPKTDNMVSFKIVNLCIRYINHILLPDNLGVMSCKRVLFAGKWMLVIIQNGLLPKTSNILGSKIIQEFKNNILITLIKDTMRCTGKWLKVRSIILPQILVSG